MTKSSYSTCHTQVIKRSTKWGFQPIIDMSDGKTTNEEQAPHIQDPDRT